MNIKYGVDQRLKAIMDARSLATSKTAQIRRNAMLYAGAPSLYWALGRNDEASLWPFAVACLEKVLELSDSAVVLYAHVVEAWDLPGCQSLKQRAMEYWPDTKTWLKRYVVAYCSKETSPEQPFVGVTYKEFKNNKDFCHLITQAGIFIFASFNRHTDIENETYKVVPGTHNVQLIKAIATRSLVDHANYDVAKLHRWQHPDIERIMTAKPYPDTRKERKIRRQITGIEKSADFNLKADDTLLELAEMWCRARVLYNTLRGAADYYHLDPFDLSKRIRPCDDATGYPYRK